MEQITIQETGWAESRGLDAERAAMNGLISSGKEIGFQYEFSGQRRFVKWRKADKSGWRTDPPGKEMCFFNADSMRDYNPTPEMMQTPLIITEGELDAVSVMQAGFPFVISVPTGANIGASSGVIDPDNDTAFSYVYHEDTPSLLNKFEKIILFTDADDPGFTLRNELAIRLGKTRCYFVQPPEGCKDANDILMRHGEEALKAVVDEAKPMTPDRIVGIYDLPPEPETPVIKTGFDGLDSNLLLTKPEFCVILGRPGTGKSQWLRTLAWHLSFGSSRETFKTGSEIQRGVLIVFEDKLKRVKRDMEEYMRNTVGAAFKTPEERTKVRNIINNRIFMRTRTRDVLDMNWLIEVMIEAKTRHNIDYVVLDPWNEIEHDFKRESETVYTGNAIRRIKRVCEDYGITFLVAIHPAKPDQKQKLDMYSASGSAHWYNKCDHGIIFEHVPWAEGVVECWVQKSKDWETMGKPGKLYMRWNRDKRDYRILTGEEVATYKEIYEEEQNK